jgi:undecaprenyl-diphosphatase
LDERLFRLLYGDGSPRALTLAMIALTVVGGGWGLTAFVPLLIAQRTRRFALALGAVITTQSIVVWALKRAFTRVRPFRALDLAPIFDAPSDFSFPSGHAAGSFSVAAFVVVTLYARRRGPYATPPAIRARAPLSALAIAAALSISISRVYLGVHYPSDVLAGAALGALIGTIGALVHRRRVVRGVTAASDRSA